MSRHLNFVFALTITYIAFITLIALFPEQFTTQSPTSIDLANEFASFSPNHPLGQGENGVDLWSQIVYGARISLMVAIVVVCITLFIGTLLGSISGLSSGWVDQLLMFITDIIFAFPGILLAIALAAVLGPSLKNVMILLSLTGWPAIFRLVRGEILRLKQREFIEGAKALGASSPWIFLKHLLPNMVPILIIQGSFNLASVIVVESSLSFLGLGVPPGTPTWGAILASGKRVLMSHWHVIAIPGLALMFLVLSCNALGEFLKERLDPR